MSTKRRVPTEPSEPFPADEIETYHSPEPWTQDGRYIRDAKEAIVVRGRTLADARRIVAAINATRDIPTDALEHWLVQDVSDPVGRPDLEIAINDEVENSPFVVRPPDDAPALVPVGSRPRRRPAAPEAESWPYTLTAPERRKRDLRRGERRSPGVVGRAPRPPVRPPRHGTPVRRAARPLTGPLPPPLSSSSLTDRIATTNWRRLHAKSS